jgi:hypothetical protein
MPQKILFGKMYFPPMFLHVNYRMAVRSFIPLETADGVVKFIFRDKTANKKHQSPFFKAGNFHT